MRVAFSLRFGLDLLQRALLLDAKLFEGWIVVDEILRDRPRGIGGKLACGLARRTRLAFGLRGAPPGDRRGAPFFGQILDARRVEPCLGFIPTFRCADGFGQSLGALGFRRLRLGEIACFRQDSGASVASELLQGLGRNFALARLNQTGDVGANGERAQKFRREVVENLSRGRVDALIDGVNGFIDLSEATGQLFGRCEGRHYRLHLLR